MANSVHSALWHEQQGHQVITSDAHQNGFCATCLAEVPLPSVQEVERFYRAATN